MIPPVVSSRPQRRAKPRLLANTGWNVAGQVVPMLVGIAVLPLLIRTMGLDRYGFLTLVWVLVGYASIFDFGIGRVLIRIVASRLAHGDHSGAAHASRVGMTFMTLFGLIVGAAFAIGSAWIVERVVKIPADLLGEALQAMWLLGASIPFVMLTTGYGAVLSGHQQFRGLNLIRAGMGIASYLGPLAVAYWFKRLDALVGFILIMRIVATVIHAELTRRSCSFHFFPIVPDRPTTRELFKLGGWVSVSNIISPMLSCLDRLLLGALVPVRMVAFYATPFDLGSKILVLPYSLSGALFPAAAAIKPGGAEARELLHRSTRLIFVLVLPFVFGLVALARPGLDLWLGREFAEQSTSVLQLIALGLLFNALAQGPAMLIQAAGQPRMMALLHCAELPFFVAFLYLLTNQYGIVGTALAATLRNVVDAAGVFILARLDVARGPIRLRPLVLPVVVATLLLLAAYSTTSPAASGLVFALGLLGFAAFSWKTMLRQNERAHLLGLLKRDH